MLSQKVSRLPRFVSKSVASSTFCLKKCRVFHLLSQKVSHFPPFVSKSVASSTYCLKKYRIFHRLAHICLLPKGGVATDAEVDAVHRAYEDRLRELFEANKEAAGYPEATLEVL